MITVFYDGICGLCSREIAYYRRIAPDGVFQWVDITADATPLTALGISYAKGLEQLHSVDSKGRLNVGVDTFLLIWRHLSGWKVLAAIVGFPALKPIVVYAYKAFAKWRFRRLRHCQVAHSARQDNPK